MFQADTSDVSGRLLANLEYRSVAHERTQFSYCVLAEHNLQNNNKRTGGYFHLRISPFEPNLDPCVHVNERQRLVCLLR